MIFFSTREDEAAAFSRPEFSPAKCQAESANEYELVAEPTVADDGGEESSPELEGEQPPPATAEPFGKLHSFQDCL